MVHIRFTLSIENVHCLSIMPEFYLSCKQEKTYPLILLLLQLVLGLLQLLLDFLDVFVHLPDGRVQNLPNVKSKSCESGGRKLVELLNCATG